MKEKKWLYGDTKAYIMNYFQFFPIAISDITSELFARHIQKLLPGLFTCFSEKETKTYEGNLFIELSKSKL